MTAPIPSTPASTGLRVEPAAARGSCNSMGQMTSLTTLHPPDPLAVVLRTPNTYQGSGELREVVLRSLLLTGEAFVLPLYDGGRVTALHVIPQSAITIPLVRLSLAEAPVVSYHLAGSWDHPQEHSRTPAADDSPPNQSAPRVPAAWSIAGGSPC